MSGTWGNHIKYTIFGESHGEGIGMVIDGLPSGFQLDLEEVAREMQRRRPGASSLTTSRSESDMFKILSGFFHGRATGTPLCIVIENANQHSGDYEKLKGIPRPGHGDYTGHIKYNGFQDYRGGGHFSGRLTAPLVFAGAVAKQLLGLLNIRIGAHIASIGKITDSSFRNFSPTEQLLSQLGAAGFPTVDSAAGEAMKQRIDAARKQRDSVGGTVETAVLNLPAGLGSPLFDSLESTLSHLVFSIPGAKAIEFGDGLALAEMLGSEAKDPFILKEGKICTSSNHNGGLLGGISSGMPLIFKTAFKPTPSIGLPQNTVDLKEMKELSIEINGRHDPCIVPRALPVVEAVTAIAILEHLSPDQIREVIK
jgi:chorismate synthase